jgi:hypothetical protein
MVVMTVVIPMVPRIPVLTDENLRPGSAPFAGQHESHEENDDRTAQRGTNEVAWIGGGVFPRYIGRVFRVHHHRHHGPWSEGGDVLDHA